jgi:sortase A
VAASRSQVTIPVALRRLPRLCPPFLRSGSPRSGRASGFLGGLAIFVGLVLLADALVTAVWEDPLTAIFTQQEQRALGKRLAAVEGAPLPASTLELVRRAGSESERMSLLAGHLRGTTRSGDPLGRISIPKTHTNFVYVSGTGEQSLKKGPGHYMGSGLPGEGATVAIAGHRTTYAAPFRRLDRLRKGNPIVLTMSYGKFVYRVQGSRSVPPTKTSVLHNKPYERLVLTTCTPLGSAESRLVVTARLEHAEARGAAIKLLPIAPRPPRWQIQGPGAQSPLGRSAPKAPVR